MKETLMNMIRKSMISLSLVLIATPVISGRSLSRYRKFVLGASLAAISKQVGKDESQATLISQSPALIQQMTYWQADTSDNSGGMEPISHITLDFYNGALYRIAVVYDEKAVEGLTEEDMVKAISERVNAQAEAAIVESAKLAKEQAPQKEIARQIKEVDDLDIARQKNIKSFRP